MEWIDALRGSTVGLDTGPLIYYIEEHPVFLAKIKPFFEAAERNEFRIVTSFVTLTAPRSRHWVACRGSTVSARALRRWRRRTRTGASSPAFR